jgi:serine/threonine-protein kinase
MPFNVGEQVGPYRVTEKLGQGGMATVFKAYHAALDRYVALKVLHPAFKEDENFLARFQREARVVAKLEHPNIVPVYDFAEHEGQPYLVMKFIEGETLKARLKSSPLSPEEGIAILEAVGQALSYAHKQDILHRDIKPSNVILAADGHVYLTDFGLARIATAGESTLSSDRMLGTPQYISPEQAMGVQDLNAGTDVYSFGVLIYELVVGRVPFSADTPFSVVHDHIYAPLPLPSDVNPKVPEAVERVLLKALAKDREDRYENVESLIAAFKKAVTDKDMPELWSAPALPAYSPPLESDEQAPSTSPQQSDSTTPPPISVPASQRQPTKQPPTNKRRWRWWYLVPIVIVSVCLCLTGLAILSSDNDTTPNLREQNQAYQDEAAPEIPADSLELALEKVAANPDDPFAQLDLAGVYLDLGRQQDAIAAFERGSVIAGDNPIYYTRAGDMLSSRDLWFQALEQYIEAFMRSPEELPTDFISKISKALYFAAGSPEMTAEFFENTLDKTNIDPVYRGLLETSFARYQLLNKKDAEQARRRLDLILSQNPDLAPALLVRAEVHHAQGQIDEAIEILERLVELNSTTPPWVQVEARRLLNTIR